MHPAKNAAIGKLVGDELLEEGVTWLALSSNAHTLKSYYFRNGFYSTQLGDISWNKQDCFLAVYCIYPSGI